MSQDVAPVDGRIEIVAPENIAFQYQVAGPFRRLAGFGIDVLIQLFILVSSGIVFYFVSGMTVGIDYGRGTMLIVAFLVFWFYGGLSEAFWNGQTIGKRSMSLRTVTTSGQPINGVQAILRNVFRFVDLAPYMVFPAARVQFLDIEVPPIPLFLVGLVTMTLNNRHQRLGDLVSQTMVVHEQHEGVGDFARLGDPRVRLLAAEIRIDWEIRPSFAKALSLYVHRRGQFGQARRGELASHLARPLIKRLQLLPDTDPDLLLCAVYHHIFLEDTIVGEAPRAAPQPPAPDPLAPLPLSEPLQSQQVWHPSETTTNAPWQAMEQAAEKRG